jgi:hypothetical protein
MTVKAAMRSHEFCGFFRGPRRKQRERVFTSFHFCFTGECTMKTRIVKQSFAPLHSFFTGECSMKSRIFLVGVIVLGWAACVQATLIYAAAAEFSASSNPNGVWSYGHYGTPGDASTFTAYDVAENAAAIGIGGVTIWHYSLSGNWDPNVAYNTTGSAIVAPWATYAPHTITLGPTNGTVVRWTASAAGTYDVSATFTDVSSGGGAAYVYGYVNSVQQFSATTSPATWTASALSVVAGHTIDFVAGPEGNGWAIPTRLDATITLVPEPSSIVLLVLGVLGLVCYARRKRT